MITKHTKNLANIFGSYELDIDRCEVNTDPENGTILLQELDYELNGVVTDENMKKLIASKFEPDQNQPGRHMRIVIGELDYSVSEIEGQKVVQVNDYAARNKEVLKQLFKFLENRAVAKESKFIDLYNYSFKPLSFLEEFGYVCYAKENNMVSAWAKTKLKNQPFNGSLKTLKDSVEEESKSKN